MNSKVIIGSSLVLMYVGTLLAIKNQRGLSLGETALVVGPRAALATALLAVVLLSTADLGYGSVGALLALMIALTVIVGTASDAIPELNRLLKQTLDIGG